MFPIPERSGLVSFQVYPKRKVSSIGLGSTKVCWKHSLRRFRASVKSWSRWSGSLFLGRSKGVWRRINNVDIINDAPRQKSSHTLRLEQIQYKGGIRMAQKGSESCAERSGWSLKRMIRRLFSAQYSSILFEDFRAMAREKTNRNWCQIYGFIGGNKVELLRSISFLSHQIK